MLYVEKTSVKATPSMPFSQKLTALASARDRFRNPKRLDIRIAAIRALLPVRADVVPSVLEIASSYDGKIVTFGLPFPNTSDRARSPLFLTPDQLATKTNRLNKHPMQFPP